MNWEDLINGAIGAAPVGGSGGNVDAGYVVEGLVQRGLPRHVAEGFAMNMQDESGLNPGINEQNPLVAGSRGGYGLYQLTGPRRRAYESFAAQKGVSVDNADAQLDFLVWELDNTEKRARDRILSTNNSGEAGAAIVNDFLRPSEEQRNRRASKYLGGGGAAVTQGIEPTYNKLWLGLGE